MLANVVGHEGLLYAGQILECSDPRVEDWIAAGWCEAVADRVVRGAATAQAATPAAPLPSPAPEPHMAEEMAEAPRAEKPAAPAPSPAPQRRKR